MSEQRRDARVDPQTGDVLELKKGCCTFRHVESNRFGKVTYHSRCGNQWFNSAMRDTIEEWREIMKDAAVIHTADERSAT